MLAALGLLAAGTLSLTTARPVSADCDGPVPSFRQFAPAAPRIVIGEVTSVDLTAPWRDDQGRSSRFTLRVEYVVRGEAPAALAVRDAPFLACADHIIIAAVGDRLALAFGVPGLMGPADPFLGTIPAWIRGTPMFVWEKAETVTVPEVFSLAGMASPPPTSTQVAPARPVDGSVLALVGVVAPCFGVGLVLWRRRLRGTLTRSGKSVGKETSRHERLL